MATQKQKDLVSEVTDLLAQLAPLALGDRSVTDLNYQDQIWLTRLAELMQINLSGEPSNTLKNTIFDIAALKKNEAARSQLEKLYFSCRAMSAAFEVGGQSWQSAPAAPTVVIHNRQIAEHMRLEYDLPSFDALMDICHRNNVFDLKIDSESGLVTTSEVEENWDMNGRQWVTDTVRCGDIERDTNPQAWSLALLTLCDFYAQEEERASIAKSIADPDYYRLGGLLNGVAHIFLPHTLKRDTTWLNNKRLESHGLALKALCDTAMAGALDLESWGFSQEQLSAYGEKIAGTIVCLASYLKAINTDKNGHFDCAAPSAGAWEEIVFEGGLTWDTEAMRSGFESLRHLMFNPAGNNNSHIEKMRQLIVAHQYGQWLASDIKTIDHLLKQARGKIIDRLFGQVMPVENPQRPLDCSLAFISTSTISLADDPLSDVLLHFQLLQVLEENLVRTHGIVRYASFDLTLPDGQKERVFDSYLADNYWLLPSLRASLSKQSLLQGQAEQKEFGSSDCSTDEAYLARVKSARPGTEANWCFVSVLAEAYCRQVIKLRRIVGSQPNAGVQNKLAPLIALGISKATEYLNRSFARITAPDTIKANGRDCPAWAVPEAYEMVSPIGSKCHTELAALPGANTPLAWGQSSLFSAALLFRQILVD